MTTDNKDEKVKEEEHINTKTKEEATEAKEPWVNVLAIDVDYEDVSSGVFELDWNDYFISRLMKHGYQGKTDADLVDQWFSNVCKNVVLETYEQEQADPVNRSRKLNDGRREFR